MKYNLFFILLLHTHLYALNIQEAITLALAKSHALKTEEYLLQEVQYNAKKSQSSFYPKLNASYQYHNNITNTNKTNIQLRYNLFNGFIDWNNFNNQQALLKAQEYNLEATKHDLILAIKTAYILLLQQKHELLVAEESIKLLEQQKKETTDFYHVGIVPKNDLLKVEVQLSNAQQALLTAQSNLAYTKKDLERYIGQKVEIDNLQEVAFTLPASNLEELQEIMFSSRAELKMLQEELKSKQYMLKSTQGAYYPTIDIVGEKNFTHDQTENDFIAKIEISFNIFNGFETYNNIQAKKSSMLSLSSRISELKEELNLQLFSAFEAYTLAVSAYEVAQESLMQAEENYRIASNRYKERIESTSNFLDAEFLLTQAKINLLINRYGISDAIARIIRITQIEQKEQM